MCKVLQIPRSTYYYEAKERTKEDDMTADVIDVFQASRQNYGTRKIKVELQKRGLVVSRRRIGRIMQEQGLVSTYTSLNLSLIRNPVMDQTRKMN